MLNTLLCVPICHQRPLLAAVSSPEQVSDLLLLNFIPSKLYPLAGPEDSRRGTPTEHMHAYMGTETCRRRECAHRYSSLPCLQAVFHLGKRGALSRWEFKAFSIVRCQQPCSGMTAAAATVCEHKSAGFSPSQHPAGTLPNSLPNYKKITYGTKAAVCPHYVRYYHAHDCHGLRSSQATTTNCPPLLKGAKPFPLLRELFQVPELTGA